MEARALSGLARLATEEGQVQEALTLFAEAHRVDREFGDPSRVAVELVSLAQAASLANDAEVAVQLLSLGVQRAEEVGTVNSRWISSTREYVETQALEQLGEAGFTDAWAAGRELTPDEAFELALHRLASA
jgi:hypothetical protein